MERVAGTDRGSTEALALAERLVDGCARVLGQRLLSMAVHGSLTLGDFVFGQSDVDLLGIVERRLTDAEIESLTRAASAELRHAPCPADLRFVTRAVAARPHESPPMELYVRMGGSARLEVEARRPEPDLLVELSIAREHGRELFGAPPRELVGAIRAEWVASAGDAQLARWQSLTDDAPHAVLMVLTACRVWRYGEEQVHCSKSAAAAWALERDPSLRAVRDALRRRAGEPVEIEPAEIGRLLGIVRASM